MKLMGSAWRREWAWGGLALREATKEANPTALRKLRSDFGAALYIIAASMVVLLAIAALAIDLVSLFVARSEAQRAADAAALAGAYVLSQSGCITNSGGCVAGGAQEAPATAQAINVAAQDLVGGQAPSAASMTTSFSYPNSSEPQINVTVFRDAAHGNPMPTFFAKVLGVSTVDVSATATAEAYGGYDVPIGLSCVRPFLVPNCDPTHPVPAGDPEANPKCGAVTPPAGQTGTWYTSYFFDPQTKAIVNPGIYNASTNAGVVGMPWQLHSGAAPSQWYLIGFTGSSGAQLRDYIETCAPRVIACSTPLNTANGKKVGPVDQGIDALIHASADGLNQGQDTICSPTTSPACTSTPFPITGGANNPNPDLVGKVYYGPSDSVTNVVVYDGTPLDPGGSIVTVIGYMNLFVVDADHNGQDDIINGIILSIEDCGDTSGDPVVGSGGAAVPIRLIRQ